MAEQNFQQGSEIPDLLLRTNELLTALLKNRLAPELEREFEDADKKKLYEMTGSGMTISEISKKLELSTGKISGIWKRWEQMGFLTKDGAQYRKIF